MTRQEKDEAFAFLHRRIVIKLMSIEAALADQGLGSITNFTVIARDPNNDDMCLVVTNDVLEDALRVAANNATLAVA